MSLRNALSKPIIEQRSRIVVSGTRVKSGATTLIELLAPDGVDRSGNRMIQVGDSYITTLELRGFPLSLDLAWLSDPSLGLDAPGVTIHQRVTPLHDALARRILARSEDAALGTLVGDMQAGTNLDVDAQQGMEAAAALRRDLAAGADRMFQYAISITIAAPTPEELAARVDTVRLAASQAGIQLGVARFQQWEGYIESLPFGREELGLLHDTSGQAVAMGMPTATPGLRHDADAINTGWPHGPLGLTPSALAALLAHIVSDAAFTTAPQPDQIGITKRRLQSASLKLALFPEPQARALAEALMVWFDAAGILADPAHPHDHRLNQPRALGTTDLARIAERLRRAPLPTLEAARAAFASTVGGAS